jgi:hypothetical protein
MAEDRNFIPLGRAKQIYEKIYSDIIEDIESGEIGYSSYGRERLKEKKLKLLDYGYEHFPMYKDVWTEIFTLIYEIYDGIGDPQQQFEYLIDNYPELPPLFAPSTAPSTAPKRLGVKNPDGSIQLATRADIAEEEEQRRLEGEGARKKRTNKKSNNPWIRFIQQKVKRTKRSYRDVLIDPKTKQEYNKIKGK